MSERPLITSPGQLAAAWEHIRALSLAGDHHAAVAVVEWTRLFDSNERLLAALKAAREFAHQCVWWETAGAEECVALCDAAIAAAEGKESVLSDTTEDPS